MERKLTILAPFFEEPGREFHIRELAKLLKTNHTTIRSYLNRLVKEEFLEKIKSTPYTRYTSKATKKYLNLKLYYNLEKLRKSGLIEEIEKVYDFPPVILFGSYAKAWDDTASDVDLCLISNIKKQFSAEPYERILNRKVSVHHFTKQSWNQAKQKNPELINSICNGLVLSGQLEIL